MSRATKVAVAAKVVVAASLALCVASCACGRAESGEAREHERFEFESAGRTNDSEMYGAHSWVMTDTETGRQWVVVRVSDGGAAIAPLEVDE